MADPITPALPAPPLPPPDRDAPPPPTPKEIFDAKYKGKPGVDVIDRYDIAKKVVSVVILVSLAATVVFVALGLAGKMPMLSGVYAFGSCIILILVQVAIDNCRKSAAKKFPDLDLVDHDKLKFAVPEDSKEKKSKNS